MEVCKSFNERDQFSVKWEQGDGSDEGFSTSAKKVIEERHGLLAKGHDTILWLTNDEQAQLSVENGCSNYLKGQVTDLTGHVMKVNELLHTSRSKEKMALTKVKRLDAQ